MKQINNDFEHRSNDRYDSDVPIELSIENLAAHHKEYLNNISSGGLSFKSHSYIDSGTIIEIRIPLLRPVFQTRAKVIWCNKQDSWYDVGVEFIERVEPFKARMVAQICDIEHYKNEIKRVEGRALSGEEAALEWIAKHAQEFSLENDNI